jgi:pyruvate dehydrogenase E1 component
MYGDQEQTFYYITVMNEQYEMPAMPKGAEEGIIKGLYKFRAAETMARRAGDEKKADTASPADRERCDPQ